MRMSTATTAVWRTSPPLPTTQGKRPCPRAHCASMRTLIIVITSQTVFVAAHQLLWRTTKILRPNASHVLEYFEGADDSLAKSCRASYIPDRDSAAGKRFEDSGWRYGGSMLSLWLGEERCPAACHISSRVSTAYSRLGQIDISQWKLSGCQAI